MKNKLNIFLVLLFALGSCKNEKWEFPDYDTQTVYFAYQGPIRTVTIGEDIFDTSLDNAHKIKIMGTVAGVYENKEDVTINISVDNALTQGLSFPAPYSGSVRPMPANYYTLASDKIVIPEGSLIGGVEVQLTDAFFADPLSIATTYVIPLTMTSVDKNKTILPDKKSTLYAVKYINTWEGFYLRRGKDVVAGKSGNTSLNETIVRHTPYVEKDEINKLNTRSLTQTVFPVPIKEASGTIINRNLILTFDNSGNCTIAAGDASFIATGSGKFVKRGEKNSWGNQDRDALYLSYQIELSDRAYTTLDTLVMRDRGVKAETFTPIR